MVAGKRVTNKTNGLAEGNVVARIALAGARRGQTCHWIGCSANDGTRGGGIKHAPEREGAAQKIVARSTLTGDQLRKVRVAARPLLGGGDGRHLGGGLPDASAFVIEEEKRFVLAIVDARYGHRAANRAAKLVLAEFAFGDAAGVLKEVGRVKLVIADELPQGAMNLVGTGLDRGIEHRPARASELGAEVARLNLELLDGIDWRLHGIGGAVQKVHGVIVVVDAVQNVVVVGGGQPVGGETPGRFHPPSRRRFLGVRYLSHRGIGGLKLWRSPNHLDRLGHRPRHQREVHHHLLLHVDRDVRMARLLEARGFDHDRVIANLERCEDVAPVTGSGGAQGEGCAFVREHHLRAGNHRG